MWLHLVLLRWYIQKCNMKSRCIGLGAASGPLRLLYHQRYLPRELFVMLFKLNTANTASSLILFRPKVYCMEMHRNFTYKHLFWQKFRHGDLMCFTARNSYADRIPMAIFDILLKLFVHVVVYVPDIMTILKMEINTQRYDTCLFYANTVLQRSAVHL